MVSFAQNDSRDLHKSELFSLQALNDSLTGGGPTTIEINLRAEKGSRPKSRSKSRGKLSNSRLDPTKAALGMVA